MTVPQVSWLALTNEEDSSCELMEFPKDTFDADDAAGVATLSDADVFDRSCGAHLVVEWGATALLDKVLPKDQSKLRALLQKGKGY